MRYLNVLVPDSEGYIFNGHPENFLWTSRNSIFSQLIPAVSSNLRISHLDDRLETGGDKYAQCTVEVWGEVRLMQAFPAFSDAATLHYNPPYLLALLQTFPKSPKLHYMSCTDTAQQHPIETMMQRTHPAQSVNLIAVKTSAQVPSPRVTLRAE